jgi:hypothetical protein
VTVRDVPFKDFTAIYNEIYPEIDSFKKEKNQQHNKNNDTFKLVPSL